METKSKTGAMQGFSNRNFRLCVFAFNRGHCTVTRFGREVIRHVVRRELATVLQASQRPDGDVRARLLRFAARPRVPDGLEV